MLEIKDLSYSIGQRQIFDRCQLEVQPREHIAIVGDSGGGKSTLLNLIADGHPQITVSGDSVSMVLQEGALLEHLSVIENLRLVERYTQSNNKSPEQLLESVNIDSTLHNANVQQLSGGQMRRVAIARALLTSPNVLLFDEPDAGLDLQNLLTLAQTIKQLIQPDNVEQTDMTCVTVSHNPFFISRIATKVYRLHAGKLQLLADWGTMPADEHEAESRQMQLQGKLMTTPQLQTINQHQVIHQREWLFPAYIKGLTTSFLSLFHFPKSLRDSANIGGYSVYLSFLSGIVFFSLVGMMLGATTVAVVRTLADSALTGVVSWFVDAEDLVEMMRGRFALYLAPAVGGMLFVARSGSIVCNWLGEMVKARQVRALQLLGVPIQQYLIAPNVIALFLGIVATLCLFCAAIWCGGVIATEHLFDIDNTYQAMAITEYDFKRASFVLKTLIYSVLVAFTVTAFAFTPKNSAHQVNVHTTKCIIYATLAIAVSELALILL